MMPKIIVPAVGLLVASVTPSIAQAESSSVTCVAGQFADHIDAGKPVGDAKSIADAHKALYWLDLANTGDATQVTLVWKVDGTEVQRQSLDVGTSPHWHTWGSRPLPTAASKVEVQVLGGSDASIKEDAISF